MIENQESNIRRRPHLTKEQRLPNCYKEVEKIVKSVKSCQTNFKTALAKSKLRGSQFKKVYKLSLNVLKYHNYIQKIIDKSQLLEKEKFLRKEIAAVLIYELIFGNGSLPGASKAVTTVQAHQNDLMNVHQELQNCNVDLIEFNEIHVPRYARIHTLVSTVASVIKDLENYGFKQIFYNTDLSEEKFIQLVKSLERGNFMVDFHFKDILVFSQAENLIELDLYKNGHIFLQDKASYIPVHVLNPEPGSTVLDACAAPGMKSAHIASKMKNKGILIACERDESRFETLKETLKYGSVKISKTLCSDFKVIDPTDEAYSSVDYILLDPSCSGSGMVSRMDNITDTENSKTKERLSKLAGFQIILLKHALKFPSVKRVVYSTCSVHEEENEYVVHEALNAFGSTFKLVPVISEWFDRGSENYECGKMCLRTVPEKHLTNGFFVAMFERIEMQEHSTKYFSVKHSKNETAKKFNGMSLNSFELASKNLKTKTTLSQSEISYKNKIDETTEKCSMDDLYKHGKHASSVYKEKKYSSSLQGHTDSNKNNEDFQSSKQLKQSNISDSIEMAYKSSEITQNHDQYIAGLTNENYTEERKKIKTPEFTKHKKKRKKSLANIEFQSTEQNQEELIRNSLQQECGYSAFSEIHYTEDKNSSVYISEKKTKHKRHLISDNAFENLGTNYNSLSDVKLKHKKIKNEKKNYSCAEQQCDNSEVLYQSAGDQCCNQNIVNVIHDSFSQEEPKVVEFSKRKKRDKEGTNKLKYSKQDQMEIPKSTLSESLQKSNDPMNFVSSPLKSNDVVVKKPKHKEQLSENDAEVLENYEMFDESKLKHKKKKRKRKHSTEGNSHIYAQDIKQVNKINPFKNIPEKFKQSSEFTLSCIKSNCLENEPLKCDKYSSNIPLTVKKHKKHKKHSKHSDFTTSQLNKLSESNILEFQSNLENYSLVKSAENLSHVSQKEEMIEKQYLVDNNSKCKKNRKHEKHARKSNRAVFSPNKNPDYILSDTMNKDANKTVPPHSEEMSINSPNHECYIKKKRKKCKSDETCDISNFHYSNTNAQDRYTVHDLEEVLLQNDTESIVTPLQNDCLERRKRKKHKKHLIDDMCFISLATGENNVKDENVSTIRTNPMDSFHSEVRSKNSCKIKKHNTEIPLRLSNLSLLEEPEIILLSSSDEKKKKKKHKTQRTINSSDNVEEENVSTIRTNLMDSFHSESRFTNSCKIREHNTEIPLVLDNLSLPQEPEIILLSSSEGNKKKKKHKKERTMNSTDNVEEENVSTIRTIPMNLFHSEVRTKNSCKIREHNTEIPVQLNNLSLPKEPEIIVLSSSKVKKKKKKHEKQRTINLSL